MSSVIKTRTERPCYRKKEIEVRVEVRNNNVDGALRILKKKLQREGFYTELRDREYHQTKGEKRRLAKAAGRRRCLKELDKRFDEYGY
jgi:small subunit ribosomal protein S21